MTFLSCYNFYLSLGREKNKEGLLLLNFFCICSILRAPVQGGILVF